MSAMVLGKQGHRVDVAVNRQDALDKLSTAQLEPDQEHNYDAVLTGILMPGTV